MEPYADPLRDQMDELESSIESPLQPKPFSCENPDHFADEVARSLSEVERSIEGLSAPPPSAPAPEPLLLPPPPQPLALGPPPAKPPVPREPVERPWVQLKPPPAARPYFFSHGPGSSPYRFRGRGGTGVQHTRESSFARFCPERHDLVTQETCAACEHWGDHGDGYDRCYYEWLEEQNAEEREDEADEDE